MQVDAREKIEEALKSAIRKELPDLADSTPTLERPRNPDHGDFATPDALNLAKRARQNPRKLAESIAASSAAALGDVVTAVDVAGPGFINFRLSPIERRAIVPRVLRLGDRFGRRDVHKGERVIVEFVSANPTGPLHVGHGRQAALGDAIDRLLGLATSERRALAEALRQRAVEEFDFRTWMERMEGLYFAVRAAA